MECSNVYINNPVCIPFIQDTFILQNNPLLNPTLRTRRYNLKTLENLPLPAEIRPDLP